EPLRGEVEVDETWIGGTQAGLRGKPAAEGTENSRALRGCRKSGAGNSGRAAPGHRSVEPDRTNAAHLALPLLFGTGRAGNADHLATSWNISSGSIIPKRSTRTPSPTRARNLRRGQRRARCAPGSSATGPFLTTSKPIRDGNAQ